MAEPFVFHFSPDAQRRPQLMSIVDLRLECGLCKHPQLQRFYHALPFHTLTWRGLERLARSIHELAGYECENCGEHVGPSCVLDSVLTYGFADHAGEVLTFVHEPNGQAKLTYQLKPDRRLDPQIQPVFTPDVQLGPVFEGLKEPVLEATLGRPFSLKVAWIELMSEHLQKPELGLWAALMPGYWVFLAPNTEALIELLDQADDPALLDALESGDVLVLNLNESTPEGLATHDHPEAMYGQWRTWLPPHQRELIERGEVIAHVILETRPALKALEYAFQTARLTYTLERDDLDKVVAITDITTPREGAYSRRVALAPILHRALFTGISVGEAARLTAEEIVGLLLRVWS